MVKAESMYVYYRMYVGKSASLVLLRTLIDSVS